MTQALSSEWSVSICCYKSQNYKYIFQEKDDCSTKLLFQEYYLDIQLKSPSWVQKSQYQTLNNEGLCYVCT